MCKSSISIVDGRKQLRGRIKRQSNMHVCMVFEREKKPKKQHLEVNPMLSEWSKGWIDWRIKRASGIDRKRPKEYKELAVISGNGKYVNASIWNKKRREWRKEKKKKSNSRVRLFPILYRLREYMWKMYLAIFQERTQNIIHEFTWICFCT